jgi:hypothetical protein
MCSSSGRCIRNGMLVAAHNTECGAICNRNCEAEFLTLDRAVHKTVHDTLNESADGLRQFPLSTSFLYTTIDATRVVE